MIEIKKIENKSASLAAISKFQLKSTEDDIVMGVFSGMDLIGAGALSLECGKVYLADMKLDDDNSDMTMFLSLARSLLFHADLKGIKKIYAKNDDIYPILKLLRFKEENGELSLSLDGFFSSECE